MKLGKPQKGLIIAAVVALAIGGAVTLGGGSGLDSIGANDAYREEMTGGMPGMAIDGDLALGAPDNNVQSQIDRALGRATTTESSAPPVLSKNGNVSPAPGMPYDARSSAQSAAGGGATANAGLAVAPVAPPAPGTAESMSTTADRKIVQTASIRLQVKGVGGGFEEVGRIATGAGGFIASSNFSYQGEQQVASTTIRVPSARYQEVMGQLRQLGVKVDAESSNASDVTEDYSDLTARLRNLEATETQFLSFLTQTKTVSETLQVQDRLNNTRNEIERVKGRMNLLDKLTDLSTITVHLRPVVSGGGSGQPGTGLGAEITKAWEDSLEFLGGIATGVLTAIVFVWWLPILLIPAYVVFQRMLRNRPSHAEVASRD